MRVSFELKDRHFLLMVGFLALVSAIGIATGQTGPDPGHSPGEIGPGTFLGTSSDSWAFPGSVGVGGNLGVTNNAYISGNIGLGTTTPQARLDVAGEIFSDGMLQIGNNELTTYKISTQRYIVEAPPSLVGSVVPLDLALTDKLCRDKDGCTVTIQMVNWDGKNNVASREERLFISETSNSWRFSNNDVDGVDNNGATNQWAPWDCYFGDAETLTSTSNGRSDSKRGFGLLNVKVGSYSDSTTTCRVVLQD